LYVVWLSLAPERRGVHLYDYRFEPPWPDRNFEMLPSFTESCIGEAYVLPNDLTYPRADILNYRFAKTGWRLPCARVEGVLCALSRTPIPKEYKHGASIPVGVKSFSRSGQELAAASVVLWADRWVEARSDPANPEAACPVDVADPAVAARPRRSTLFDEAGGNYLSTRPEKGPPPAARVQEDGSRAGVHGE
jgi:hypothetical protein